MADSDITGNGNPRFTHVLPGQHVYEGVLFFGYSPRETLDKVKTFDTRPDDVFVVTYPKAGTTWMQEIAWLIMNDGDIAKAKKMQVYMRSPFLEFADTRLNEIGLDIAESIASPRVIKTHLSSHLAPKQIFENKSKTILLFRNPKDVCVSYYNFYHSSSSFGDFHGTWEEFLEMFLSGYVSHGSWFDFTASWWRHRHEAHVKVVYYEDLKQDLVSGIQDIASFLGKDDLSIDVLTNIAAHCSFDQMKDNPMTNHHDVYSIDASVSPLLRKGQVGDWKNYFTVAQSERFEKLMKTKLGLGEDEAIPFTYSL